MSRSQLATDIKKLLPDEKDKRIRQAIMRAAGESNSTATRIRDLAAQDSRLKDGLLVVGEINITSTTSSTISGFGWTNDYVISQPDPETIAIAAPHPSVSRTDYFTGKDDGTYGYYPGTIDALGNSFPPTIPSGEILLRGVVRNPNGTNVIDDSSPSNSDAVSKSATAPQSIKSPLNMEALKGSIQDFIGTDPNGTLRLVPASRAGLYTSIEGNGGWSKAVKIIMDTALQVNYTCIMEILGVSAIYEKGQIWITFKVDASGNIITNGLKLFGEFTPANYKLVKTSATTYELYFKHDLFDSLYSFRPIQIFGQDFRYEFFQQSAIVASLPVGDVYDFTAHGGGTFIAPDIIDALESAVLPSSSNPFATIDDIPISPEDFIDLFDTPNAYTGAGGYKVKVKSTEDGLEFLPDSAGGGADINAVHYDADDLKTKVEKAQARKNIGSISGAPQIISVGGTYNNLDYESNNIIFTSGTVILTGLVAGENGEDVTITNRTPNALVMPLESGLSSSSNRFQFAVTLDIQGSITIKYSTNLNRWYATQGSFVGNVAGQGIYTLDQVGVGVIPQGNVAFKTKAKGTTGSFYAASFTNSNNDIVAVALGNGFASPLNMSVGAGAGVAGNVRFLVRAASGIFPFAIQNISGTYVLGTNTDGDITSSRGASFGPGASFGNLQARLWVKGAGNGVGVSLRIDNSDNLVNWNFRDNGLAQQRLRSNAFDEITRRDEQRLLYLISVTTSGTINNLNLTSGIFNYRFTAATLITGFANGEIGLTIDIDNDSGSSLALEHESASSIAANRLKLIGATDLVIPINGKVTLKYCTGSRWELVSKNF